MVFPSRTGNKIERMLGTALEVSDHEQCTETNYKPFFDAISVPALAALALC
jgi:hypothetical protein